MSDQPKGQKQRIKARADTVHQLRKEGKKWVEIGRLLGMEPSRLRKSYLYHYPGERPETITITTEEHQRLKKIAEAHRKDPMKYVRIPMREYEELKEKAGMLWRLQHPD